MLAVELEKLGAIVDDVPVYQTVPETEDLVGGIKRFRELTQEITPEQALRGAAGEPHIARAMIADAKIISLWIERLLREEIPNVEESQTRNHAWTY